ncbi:hypothetical protein IWQ61_004870 [Dispira simplex]|nr:hypothetical protein IWQ61_004870 [Dispira simplex]
MNQYRLKWPLQANLNDHDTKVHQLTRSGVIVKELTKRASRWLNKHNSAVHPQPVDKDDCILQFDCNPEQHNLSAVTSLSPLNHVAVCANVDDLSAPTSRRTEPFCLPPIADTHALSPCLATRIRKLAKRASCWIKNHQADGYEPSPDNDDGILQVDYNPKQGDLAAVASPLTLNLPKLCPDVNCSPSLAAYPCQSEPFRLPPIANTRGLSPWLAKRVKALKRKAGRWIKNNRSVMQQQLIEDDWDLLLDYYPEDHDLASVAPPPFLDLPELGAEVDGYLSPFLSPQLFDPFVIPRIPDTPDMIPWDARQVQELSVRADHCFVSPRCGSQGHFDIFSPTPFSGLTSMSSGFTVLCQQARIPIS